jgi:hypothetical protein
VFEFLAFSLVFMYVKEQAWIELLIMPRVRFQDAHVLYILED